MGYILFLDETKANNINPYFCLAGFTILETNYYRLVEKINKVKVNFFGSDDIIFHLYEMKRRTEPFNLFRDTDIREKFWKSIKDIVAETDIKVLSCCINQNENEIIYNQCGNDVYFITLQAIVENFVQFLTRQNNKGKIVIESRNEKENLLLTKHYRSLYNIGTLYINKSIIKKKLHNDLIIKAKSENEIGLQIADFIPNSLINSHFRGSDPLGLGELFTHMLYDGSCGNIEKFGFKIL